MKISLKNPKHDISLKESFEHKPYDIDHLPLSSAKDFGGVTGANTV